MTGAQPSAHQVEQTFRAYTNEQGVAYAQGRKTYHEDLFNLVLGRHVASGGRLDTLVDVGCGPGTVTLPLAQQFTRAVGFDPSEGMIAAARQQGGVSGNGEHIRFECSTAEQLGAGSGIVADGTADLITAATAAHWFDMAGFWTRAAKLLRPGGTIAIWCAGPRHCHPSVPNSEAINAAMEEIDRTEMEQYKAPGNLLAERLYEGMPLPWDLAEPVPELDKDSYFRKEWGTETGSDAEQEGNRMVAGNNEYTLDMFEAATATTSPITRWREANPDKVGTDQDIVKVMRRTIERLLHEAGVPKGQEILKGRVIGVLIMVKKKKE